LRREVAGSKTVTLSNLPKSTNWPSQAEFALDATKVVSVAVGEAIYSVRVDLHEIIGHGSGKVLPGVSAASLGAFGSALEEARADAVSLYFIADPKLVELGILPAESYKVAYELYLVHGSMQQLKRLPLGATKLADTHQQCQRLITEWVFANAPAAARLVKKEGKTYVEIVDFAKLRTAFGVLLAELQRIVSEGDGAAAAKLMETYCKFDPALHAEVLARLQALNMAPLVSYLNPKLSLVKDAAGEVTDVAISYEEDLFTQQMRYATEYSFLPLLNK
jgi:dipeptidyl-peptidase-3